MRVLTQRELNRALLARQGLLRPLPASVGVAGALERVACLQSQYAPSMYVGLWSRLAGFTWDVLDRALAARRVVQATLMRGTIHLVSAADYWPLAAVSDVRESWLRNVPDVSPERMAAAADELRVALADGPLYRKEIAARIGKAETAGANFFLPLVRWPPSGSWTRRRADRWGLAEQWVAPRPVEDPVGHAVRRYLRGCGPATRDSIAHWMGVAPAVVEPALDGLRTFAAEDGAVLHDLPRLPLPAADVAAPVRLIGHWDQILLTHCRRAGVVDEELRKRLFHVRNPHSNAVVLVDGTVAGTWKLDGTAFAFDPWATLSAADRAAVAAEGERLARAVPR